MNKVMIGLGANARGAWGAPEQAIRRAPTALQAIGVIVISESKLYCTSPVGRNRQPHYLNAVLVCRTGLPPGRLLRALKRIERNAGRRSGFVGGQRPLDLDLLDHGGRVLGWPPRRRYRERITLPHPEMHRRAFVLVPLLDVAPHWLHPALGVRARNMLMRLPRSRGDVRPVPTGWSCAADPDDVKEHVAARARG